MVSWVVVSLAERVQKITVVLGASVPEVAEVKYRVDRGWSVARLDLAGLNPPDAEGRIAGNRELVDRRAGEAGGVRLDCRF